MKPLTLVFSRGDDWISRLICFFTRASVSHVALVSPDGSEVLEATGVGKTPGVRLTSRSVWELHHANVTYRTVAHPDPGNVWDHACSQIGKGYDNRYLWGWLFHRNWQDHSAWVCHELIVWAAQQSGAPLLDMTDSQWLTPQHLYLISEPGGDAAALLDGTSSAAS